MDNILNLTILKEEIICNLWEQTRLQPFLGALGGVQSKVLLSFWQEQESRSERSTYAYTKISTRTNDCQHWWSSFTTVLSIKWVFIVVGYKPLNITRIIKFKFSVTVRNI